MKRMITILVLSTGLAATPAMAGDANRLLTSENVGGAVGATVGGLLGSQIGDGDGQLAATAAGAVGGYIVGRDIGHNYKSGYPGGYRQKYRDDRRDYRRGHDRDHDRRHSRRLRPIDKTFRARTASNVRSGPGTRFRVIDQLYHRERVHVIGKVRGRNWFMVRTGHRRGFVYAPLLRPDHRGHRSHRDHDRWRDRGHNRWYR